MKNITLLLILITTVFITGCIKKARPVNLEIIQKALIDNSDSDDWNIEYYPFGRLLHGSTKIYSVKTSWSDEAGIIICNKDIPDIGMKLIEANIAAPFQSVGFSKRYRILTWQSSELEEIQAIIDIVKQIDL